MGYLTRMTTSRFSWEPWIYTNSLNQDGAVSSTLQCREARLWYNNLQPGSINGFPLTTDKFRANFFQQRRFQKTQAEILGLRQRPKESLKDYVERFSKETRHMADRSDIMVSNAFISRLRPGRLFKDLIARPPTSLEDLFTQTNNIRAEEANNENRLRDTRRGYNEAKNTRGTKTFQEGKETNIYLDLQYTTTIVTTYNEVLSLHILKPPRNICYL